MCICWIIIKLCCIKLWTADRLFPLLPVSDIFNILPGFIHVALFIISILLLIALIFFPNRKLAFLLILIELISCLSDQNSWQPWEYQFIFMLAVFAFSNTEEEKINCWQIIVIAIYFFSGFYKLTPSFISTIWNYYILHTWFGIKNALPFILKLGYVLPLIEMTAAIGLCINKTRKISTVILITMHVFILILLGPLGLNISALVWPWNLLMIILLYQLFFKRETVFFSNKSRKAFTWIIYGWWCVLPWLHLFGYWDKSLSMVLFSGQVEQMYICTNSIKAKVQLAEYFVNSKGKFPCEKVLSVSRWGDSEIVSPSNMEPRIVNEIILAWTKMYPGDDARFFIYESGFKPVMKEVRLYNK
jgi:hypothetical protein